jgi:hypothetical protein
MDKIISNIVVLALIILPFGGCTNPGHTTAASLPAVTAVPAAANNNLKMVDSYEAKLLGLSISKPASWDSISSEESKERISSVKLEDEDIKNLVMLFASRPIVSIIKDRYKIPLPAVQITVNPKENSPDISSTAVLRRLAEIGPDAFKNYSIVNQPIEIEIDGHKAGYMKAYYTGQYEDDPRLYPVSYETWVIPRNGYYFMISAVSSQNEDAKTRSEIASIIKSIKLK